MLVLGTANPSGEASTYNGLYFRQDELASMVASKALCGIPVKAEHTGRAIGSVVSSFLAPGGALQCVLELDDSVEGAIAGGLVRNGIAADLSMGYAVDVQHSGAKGSADSRLVAGQKRTLEVSLVRKGAREGCHIHAYQEKNGIVTDTVNTVKRDRRPTDDTWQAFDMR
jgi:hypothetical protein